MTSSLSGCRENILLVGCGNMGGSLLRGWLYEGYPAGRITVVDPVFRSDDVAVHTDISPAVVNRADAIILAVKPQTFSMILPALQGAGVRKGAVVVSVAAGVRTDRLRAYLPASHIIRAMPNTPVAVRAGMTGLYAGLAVPEEAVMWAQRLMSAVGDVLILSDEALMDSVTAVAGSGPAYVFHFVEALTAAGIEAGLSVSDAAVLARQTVTGAAALLAQSDKSAHQLRSEVTSPGGTTAAALNILMGKDALTELVTRAVKAARDRGQELAADE